MSYTTNQVFMKEITGNHKQHFRVWGIFPVDNQGREGFVIQNEKLAFKTRKEAVSFIKDLKK
jgi:hypothetical protein